MCFNFMCLTVPVELAAMKFVFRFMVVGIAEMLVWLCCPNNQEKEEEEEQEEKVVGSKKLVIAKINFYIFCPFTKYG